MAKRTFIACAKTDCKWNTEGQCDKSEIYVDDGVMCASYEPDLGEMIGQMMGAMGGAMGGPMGAPAGPDPRSMLIQQMASSGPPPAPGGMSQPALPGMEGPPMGAPPPLRY